MIGRVVLFQHQQQYHHHHVHGGCCSMLLLNGGSKSNKVITSVQQYNYFNCIGLRYNNNNNNNVLLQQQKQQYRWYNNKRSRKTRYTIKKQKQQQEQQQQPQGSTTSTTTTNTGQNKSLWIRPILYQYIVSEVIPTTTPKNSSTSSSIPFIRYKLFRREKIYQYYTNDHLIAILRRIPYAIVIGCAITYSISTLLCPITYITLSGPSMVPTFLPDSSEIWLLYTRSSNIVWKWIRTNIYNMSFTINHGCIIGYSHPDSSSHVSIKRIIGLPGDTVQRYGQYIHLYIQQDPQNWGITFPDNDQQYNWIDYDCKWDSEGYTKQLQHKEQQQKQHDNNNSNPDTTPITSRWEYDLDNYTRTIIVPDGHVWVESDCPSLGIDSRQVGPIPIDWIQYKVSKRLWPFWYRTPNDRELYKQGIQNNIRPHPIPLDDETLLEYNIHRIL